MKRKKISAKNQHYNADVHCTCTKKPSTNQQEYFLWKIPFLVDSTPEFHSLLVILWLKMSSQVHRSSIKIIDVDRPAEFEFLRCRSNRLIRDLFKKNYVRKFVVWHELNYLVSIVKLFPKSAATHNLFVNLKNPKYWLGY